jgi:hypothetical protein
MSRLTTKQRQSRRRGRPANPHPPSCRKTTPPFGGVQITKDLGQRHGHAPFGYFLKLFRWPSGEHGKPPRVLCGQDATLAKWYALPSLQQGRLLAMPTFERSVYGEDGIGPWAMAVQAAPGN